MTDTARLQPSAVAPVLSKLLVLLGILGLIFAAWLLLMLTIFSHARAPRFTEYLLLGSTGLPFLLYIVAVVKKWQRATLLSVGLLAHLAWIPLLIAVSQKLEALLVLGLGAATILAVFVLYARRFPKTSG